jgi:hypothetical protein
MYLMFLIVDLKRYFMPLASGSGSMPNSHDETANVIDGDDNSGKALLAIKFIKT